MPTGPAPTTTTGHSLGSVRRSTIPTRATDGCETSSLRLARMATTERARRRRRRQRTLALAELYRDFAALHLVPLWTTRADLMPAAPSPAAVPHRWRWSELLPLARRSGDLVPVGRGGERRAISLANPGLNGAPYATPTLWAAIQYLAPGENAPEHRHSQTAFRFVLEGDGVWTVVDGDPVAMRRGDLLLTPGWCFHGHQNASDRAMAWLDGLDIPFVAAMDQGFFEFGPDVVARPVDARAQPLRAPVVRAGPAAGVAGCGAAGIATRRVPVGAHRRRPPSPARARG